MMNAKWKLLKTAVNVVGGGAVAVPGTENSLSNQILLTKSLSRHCLGQKHAIKQIVKRLMLRLEETETDKPLVFFFCGVYGCGRSSLISALADYLCPGAMRGHMVFHLNCQSLVTDEHHKKLVAADGELAEFLCKVARQYFCSNAIGGILVIEKLGASHPKVRDVLLRLMQTGKLCLSSVTGICESEISAEKLGKHLLIIVESHASCNSIAEWMNANISQAEITNLCSEMVARQLCKGAQTQLDQAGTCIPFFPLPDGVRTNIVKKLIANTVSKIKIEFESVAISEIVSLCNSVSGVRPAMLMLQQIEAREHLYADRAHRRDRMEMYQINRITKEDIAEIQGIHRISAADCVCTPRPVGLDVLMSPTKQTTVLSPDVGHSSFAVDKRRSFCDGTWDLSCRCIPSFYASFSSPGPSHATGADYWKALAKQQNIDVDSVLRKLPSCGYDPIAPRLPDPQKIYSSVIGGQKTSAFRSKAKRFEKPVVLNHTIYDIAKGIRAASPSSPQHAIPKAKRFQRDEPSCHLAATDYDPIPVMPSFPCFTFPKADRNLTNAPTSPPSSPPLSPPLVPSTQLSKESESSLSRHQSAS